MALFKVMKGGKDRLASQIKRDGYAWYTQEDGGFYIDARPVNNDGTEDTSAEITRKRINDADNTSFSASGMSATTVGDAILEVNNKIIAPSYNSETKTLILS